MRRYDLIVIGSGPAGHHAAIQGAKLGQSVAIIERRDTLGGVALNAGTIPSKTLREAVLYLTGFRQRGLYGDSYRVKDKITLPDLRFRVDRVIAHEINVFRSHFLRNGVDVLTGEASFLNPNTLQVSGHGESYEAQAGRIIIATGTRPACPEHIPFDGERVFDTDQLWDLKQIQLPKTLIVVGGGVIGIEYACAMAALGVQVTVVEKRPGILDFVDREVIDALCYHMRSLRTVIRLGEDVAGVAKDEGGRVVARLASNKTIVSDALLYAAGRVGNTDQLNLAAAGLTADDRGRLAVDGQYRTAVEHIYAAGDVIGFPSLASTSMEQGRLAACAAFGRDCVSMSHLFPYGIYTIPEISYVGKNEEQLTRDLIPYEVGVAQYREIARGQIIGDETGFLKLLFHQKTKRLLGVHIIGEGATELVHVGQMVLAHEGTIDTFVNSVFNYPTLAECYKVAALTGINKLATLPKGWDEPMGSGGSDNPV
jgi:NAD(P) transhydrogenase